MYFIVELYNITHYFLLAPSSPVDIRAIENLTDASSLVIAWSEPLITNGNIESYDVQYRGISNPVNAVSSSFSQIQTLSVNTTMALLQDLVPFSVYNISVRAYTGVGPGPFSDEISVATLEDGEYGVVTLEFTHMLVYKWALHISIHTYVSIQ